MIPDNDGITHVNVYSKGRTTLGRFLSNFALSPITTEDGDFKSIEGYWYWLSTGDDRLRRMSGYQAKKLGRELRGKDWEESPEFKRKIISAISVKLLSNPHMLFNLKSLEIPLAHYYVMGGKVIEPAGGAWVIDFLESVRQKGLLKAHDEKKVL